MPITLPTRMPDGTTQPVEYFDAKELADHVLPLNERTIRRYLTTGRWPGTAFGGRWYMTMADVVEAIASEHQAGSITTSAARQDDDDDQEDDYRPRLGVVVSDEHLDDLVSVR